MTQVVKNRGELLGVLESQDSCFVLFYASWCPFSIRFLPVYEKLAQKRGGDFVRVLLDGNETLFEEFGIDVYPSVLYFENGRLSKRLDGKHGAGLNEIELSDLIASCPVKRD